MEKLQEVLLELQVDNCESLIQDLNINKDEYNKGANFIKEIVEEIIPINEEMKDLKIQIESLEEGIKALETLEPLRKRFCPSIQVNPLIQQSLRSELDNSILQLKTKQAEAAIIISKYQKFHEDINKMVGDLLVE